MAQDSGSIITYSENHLDLFTAISPEVRRKGIIIPPPPLMRMCSPDDRATRERGREKLGVWGDEFMLGFCGYVERGKGIETLFKAVQRVSSNNHNMRLVMIGGGRGSAKASLIQHDRGYVAFEDEMFRYPEELGIADKVIWLKGYDWDSEEAYLYLTLPLPAYCRSTKESH